MITAVEFRRELHRHPELSFEEELTAQYIEKCLTEAGISHSRIAETGVLAFVAPFNCCSHFQYQLLY